MKDSTRKWIFTLLIGLILWSFMYLTRIYWYSPWCSVTPTPCVYDQVNFFDRIVFQFSNVQADFWSNVIQNFAGLVVFIAPWALFSKTIALEETLITGSISFWNLAWMEITRAAIQRPRPLVFHNLAVDGGNINQYTSFYSGHTSFVAIATLSFFFMMRRRFPHISGVSRKSLIATYLCLTLLTGLLRVLGGRHFPTDVLAGLVIGTSLTLYFQRKTE